MSNENINLGALASIKSATGRIIKGKDGRTAGELTLTTEQGEIKLTLATFDDIYRGMVNCWPVISPLKAKVVEANRKEITEAKAAEREAEKAKQRAEREAAVRKRKEEQELIRAEREQAKKDAAEKKAKEAADKLAAKKKADATKLKKAADAKAKKDKADQAA